MGGVDQMESVLETRVEKTEDKLRTCEDRLPVDAASTIAWLANEFRHIHDSIMRNTRYMKNDIKELKKMIKRCGVGDRQNVATSVQKLIQGITIYCTTILDNIAKILININHAYDAIDRIKKPKDDDKNETDADNCEKKPNELNTDLWFVADLVNISYMDRYGDVMDSLERLRKYSDRIDVIKECGYDDKTNPVDYIAWQVDGMKRNIVYAIKDLNDLLVDVNQAQCVITSIREKSRKAGDEP